MFKREPLPIANLIVGTECGASDSFSGITANPIIGNAVDKVIHGGVPFYLKFQRWWEQLRCSCSVFEIWKYFYKFQNTLKWYIELAKDRFGLTLEPNLVPKNIEGGLINNCY